MSWCSDSPEGATLSILVSPRASRTAVQGEQAGFLRIRLAAPPVDGAANDELINFLSEKLSIRRSEVSLRSGSTSKRKIVSIRGLTANVVQERLCEE